MRGNTRTHRGRARAAVLIVAALVVASCGGSDSDADEASSAESSAEPSPTTTEAEASGSTGTTEVMVEDLSTVPPEEETAESTEESVEESTESTEPESSEEPAVDIDDFRTLPPPTGEPIVFGMVNTEGAPGLDFPEMRTDSDLAVAYINEHGGVGGRPLKVEHCTAAGSPESSEECAQELTGKGVELVMLGLDLLPGYATYTAAGVPVVGALPILPPDYTADALFITGGNATTMAAMVALAAEHLGAETAGIVSADNLGANGSEASLKASLDVAGISYVSIKGGDNETDAGFQGLVRQATEGDPDVLFSLYADAGCIGMMRGRVSLGIETPTITTPICSSAEVIDVVGDDAVGWYFVAAGGPADTPASLTLQEIIEPAYGENASGSLGLGALGINNVMTLARVGNYLAAEGAEVTGPAIFERLATADDIRIFQGDNLASCGASATYPSVCDFVFPAGQYVEGGDVVTVPGFEAKSVLDYLP